MFESVLKDPGQDGLTRAARLFYVLSALGLLNIGLAVVLQIVNWQYYSVWHFIFLATAAVLAFITARGIDRQRPWARWLGYLQGIVSLANIPIGTVIGVAAIVYVHRASKAGLFAPSPRPGTGARSDDDALR